MKTTIKLLAFLVLPITFAFCSSGGGVTVKDIDGNEYKTVKIGEQIWISENLNVSKFRNGDLIPEIKSNEEWLKYGKEKQPAWCYYNNEPKEKMGKLYNWYAVNDPRGLAPEGWHVATIEEWTVLFDIIGKEEESPRKLKNTTGWESQGIEFKKPTNEFGFSALPAGSRDCFMSANFMEGMARWWSSNNTSEDEANFIILMKSNSLAGISYVKGMGCSVRCIKDLP
jgi:uncharacterized protein (TIGR02145 family)